MLTSYLCFTFCQWLFVALSLLDLHIAAAQIFYTCAMSRFTGHQAAEVEVHGKVLWATAHCRRGCETVEDNTRKVLPPEPSWRWSLNLWCLVSSFFLLLGSLPTRCWCTLAREAARTRLAFLPCHCKQLHWIVHTCMALLSLTKWCGSCDLNVSSY